MRALEHLGFEKIRQSGSHVIMRRGSKGCVVPMHGEIKVGTLAGVLRQADGGSLGVRSRTVALCIVIQT
ncbi:MAG: type II toxin-antitoxin system HicA family toxin [Thiobacillus sp.]|nr:type II toxin-antitoxin system HicA family toxin [Thiobacillus sp.]MDP2978156.1 type II toxin-antitoxin system HicA family toxin [Thiobacillus sp.]